MDASDYNRENSKIEKLLLFRVDVKEDNTCEIKQTWFDAQQFAS
jgi:hypothetical protein